MARKTRPILPMPVGAGPCGGRRALWLVPVTVAVLLMAAMTPARSLARDITSYAHVEEDGTLRVGNRRVHLYGIHIPATGRHCRTYVDPIVCGSRAALALERRIRGFVHCETVRSYRDGSVDAVCYADRTRFSDGEDLAAHLLRRGWAVALPDAPYEYHVLEDIARAQSRGLWGFAGDRVRRAR